MLAEANDDTQRFCWILICSAAEGARVERLQDCDLDAYSRLAVPMILARFPDWEAFAKVEPRPDGAGGVAEFNIPCPSSAAEHGLWVSTADEELSVGFHTHHSHFTDYNDRTHTAQIEAGVGHAADIVAERVGVVSWYRGGGFAGSSSVELPHAGPLRVLAGAGPLAGIFAGCERVTLRSWLGRYDRDDADAEPGAALTRRVLRFLRRVALRTPPSR